MAPKRSAKAALQRGTRPSPTLAMLFESPARGGVQQKSARAVEAPSHAIFDISAKQLDGKKSEVARLPNSIKGKERAVSTAPEHDSLWCDLFAPHIKADLAIHKKKVEHVEGWLKEALDGRSTIRKYRRILALSGPAGSGKSTLIRTLSHEDEVNFDVVEWANESVQRGTDPDYYWDRGRVGETSFDHGEDADSSSSSNKLGSFLASASRSPLLAMQEEDGAATIRPQARHLSTDRGRRIILLEDLPNISHPPTRASFNAALSTFLHRQEDVTCPLVLILSESTPRLDDWGVEASGRSFRDRDDATVTLRRLIPDRIRTSVGFDHIEFNSVAPTILSKALKRVLELGRKSHFDTLPAPNSAMAKELIQAVVESAEGDLRSAVNTLQIVGQRGSSILAPRGTKRTAGGRHLGRGPVDKSAIALISGRETSLVLFHALGRVLYNKRVGDPTDEDENEDGSVSQSATGESSPEEIVELPPHMRSLGRKRSRVDPEVSKQVLKDHRIHADPTRKALWRSMPIDAATLQAYLHQNYTPFCESIEQCASLSDSISIADSIRPAYEEWYHSPLIDYYNFLITVHGCLLSLPSPVPRNTTRKLKGAALFHKMKSLRENADRLADMQTAMKEEAQDGSDENGALSTLLLQATSTSLVCEVGPLLVKGHPDMISSTMKDLVALPWVSTKPPHQGEDSGPENDESEVMEDVVIISQEVDKTGQTTKVSSSQSDATQKDRDRLRLLAQSKKATVMEEDVLDDDDIEEFD